MHLSMRRVRCVIVVIICSLYATAPNTSAPPPPHLRDPRQARMLSSLKKPSHINKDIDDVDIDTLMDMIAENEEQVQTDSWLVCKSFVVPSLSCDSTSDQTT